MARELYRFAVTTPAATPKAAPLLTNLAMPARIVDEIEIIVPPGPRGELGFALAMAGNPIIPANPSQWFVTDNEDIHWPLDDFPTSGAWQLLSYNTGTYDHTIELRFLVRIPGEGADATPTTMLPAAILSAPAAISLTPAPATLLGASPLLPFQSPPPAVSTR